MQVLNTAVFFLLKRTKYP